MHLNHPKEFYKNYQADNVIDEIDVALIHNIIKFKPKTVFEFGCGSGKNLALIKNELSDAITYGMDISIINVMQSHLAGVDCVIRGDERYMPNQKFDVCFTCSVLDHIPYENIEQVIGNLISMSDKAVVIAETNEHEGDFYFKHDFEKYGFVKKKNTFISSNDGFNYFIWVLKCAE
jgi:trans-aconitate methyltransferase